MNERGYLFPHYYWEHEFDLVELRVVESKRYWIKSLSKRVKRNYFVLLEAEISYIEGKEHFTYQVLVMMSNASSLLPVARGSMPEHFPLGIPTQFVEKNYLRFYFIQHPRL